MCIAGYFLNVSFKQSFNYYANNIHDLFPQLVEARYSLIQLRKPGQCEENETANAAKRKP